MIEKESGFGGALIEFESDNPSELVPVLFGLEFEVVLVIGLEYSLGLELEYSLGLKLDDMIGLELAEIMGLEFELEDPMFPDKG